MKTISTVNAIPTSFRRFRCNATLSDATPPLTPLHLWCPTAGLMRPHLWCGPLNFRYGFLHLRCYCYVLGRCEPLYCCILLRCSTYHLFDGPSTDNVLRLFRFYFINFFQKALFSYREKRPLHSGNHFFLRGFVSEISFSYWVLSIWTNILNWELFPL